MYKISLGIYNSEIILKIGHKFLEAGCLTRMKMTKNRIMKIGLYYPNL